VGDLLTVNIWQKGGGKLVEQIDSVLVFNETSVDANVYESNPTAGDFVIPLLFSLLPGILVLAFAAMLRQQRRRTT